MALETPVFRKHVGGINCAAWSKSYTDPATTLVTSDYDIMAYARKNVTVASTLNQTVDLVVYGCDEDTFTDLVTLNSQTIAAGNVTKQVVTVPFTDHYRFLRVTLDPAANSTGALRLRVQGQQP